MKRKQEEPRRVCDDCRLGEWYDVQWNRSTIDGKPLTKHCKYRDYGLVRGTLACKYYEQA